MKCTNCNYENEHDGVYCTDCGQNFIKVIYPQVCYFIRQEVKIDFEIKNPFEESITLLKLVLAGKEHEINKKIGRGKSDITTQVSYNAHEIVEPDFTLIFEKGGKIYSLENPIKPFSLSPIPVIEITPLDPSDRFFFSPTTGFHKEFKITLKNKAVLKINGLLLLEDKGLDLYRGAGADRFWTFSLPLMEPAVEITPENPEAKVTVDFSILEKEKTEKEFDVTVRNDYGADHEIMQEKTSKKIKLLYRELVPITVGVLHAADKGFAYVADNQVFREQTSGDNDKAILSGIHMDYVDITNLQELFPDDNSIENRLAGLNEKRIIFNIPAGLKRKRRITLYQNFLSKQAEKYDIENNSTYIRIVPKKDSEIKERGVEPLTYKEIYTTGRASSNVAAGEELKLTDIRTLNAFELSCRFPPELADAEIMYHLIISRKDNSTGNIVDEQVYEMVFKTYLPKLMKNDWIAIDFGTSNTCVIGPQVLEGELFDGEPGPYPLNYYHKISEQIETFPTLISYNHIEQCTQSDPYIPDSLVRGDAYNNFKIYLPDEIAGEDSYPGSPLELTADFIGETLANLQIYFEDRNCLENIFINIQLVAPTGFIPEVRESIVEKIKNRLQDNYKLILGEDDFLDIRMDMDEPEAVFNYAFRSKQISFELNPGEFNLYGVYDFGGGTTDTSFILVDDAKAASLIGLGGSVKVGGNTVDRWLVKRFKMGTTIVDTRQASAIELDEKDIALKKAEIAGYFRNPQLSLDVSKIKHYFNIEIDPKVDLPNDLVEAFPFTFTDIFNREINSFEELQSRVRGVVTAVCKEEPKMKFWEKNINIIVNLLIPFYISFFRKVKDIINDSLKDSFKDGELIPDDSKKVNIFLLMAGNAARIGYMDVILNEILVIAKEDFPFIGNIDVRLIDRPKEAVALGAYYATRTGQMNIEKINNPPMTIFTEVPPLCKADDSLLESIGEGQGIVIFKGGEKSKNPEFGDVLVKVFRFDQLGYNPTKPQIPISKKIGSDILSMNQRLKGPGTGKKLAFVLTRTNRLEVFRFSEPEDLEELEEFKEAIKEGVMDYIEEQIRK